MTFQKGILFECKELR